MTLHFSHIGLTDGRTFMISFRWSGDRALAAGTAAATWSRIRPQTSRLRAGQSMVSTRRTLRGSPAPGREGTTCRRRDRRAPTRGATHRPVQRVRQRRRGAGTHTPTAGSPGAHARSHTSPRAAGSPAPAGRGHHTPTAGSPGAHARSHARSHATRAAGFASAGRGGRAGTGRHWTPATGSPTLRRQSNSAPVARQRRPARLRRPRRHADARGSAHGGRWR